MSIENRVKDVRVSVSLNQRDFGSKIGVTTSIVSELERGKTRVSAELIRIISESFRVSPAWLLTGEGSMFLPTEEKVVVARPSLDSLVATKEELAETEARLATENAALKRQLDEQDKRIAALEDLAKSYLPDIASRGYEGGNSVAPSSPIAAKGAK